MKRHIPNILTLMNLLSGVIAILFLSSGGITEACIMVIVASFFDLLDGSVARLLKVSSPVGLELDSLSDVVSFGVVPGMLVFSLLNNGLQFPVTNYFAFSGFLFPLFAAVRLAKFNLSSDDQKEYFKGVPVPFAAWFFISIPFIVNEYDLTWLYEEWFLVPAVVLISYLMVSTIPVVSLKFKSLRFSENPLRWMLIVFAVLSVIVIHFAAVPVLFVVTLISSFFWMKR